ncbi:sigma-70 family RNA polymerase sigma factor [uncultured Microbacterium sp.]|uniref:RNA polymerase sigma factor n=1 Tax=uncultured Microbacterium sp. TaxID=191216 RepID=UPI0028DC6BDD|nr:sigma-70 family RNA polymerase sigma factor [uncultured Microbacterium sp.]
MSTRGENPRPPRDEAFRQLFDQNWAAVRRHVEGVVLDDAQVSAIVSEVFLHAWTRLDARTPPGRIWLLRTADAVLGARAEDVGALRAAADTVEHGVLGEGTDPESGEGDSTRRGRVIRALAVLKAKERRIIMLTYWDGLSVGEIAELWRRPRGSVRRTLGRAQIRLRAALRSEGVIVDD